MWGYKLWIRQFKKMGLIGSYLRAEKRRREKKLYDLHVQHQDLIEYLCIHGKPMALVRKARKEFSMQVDGPPRKIDGAKKT